MTNREKKNDIDDFDIAAASKKNEIKIMAVSIGLVSALATVFVYLKYFVVGRNNIAGMKIRALGFEFDIMYGIIFFVLVLFGLIIALVKKIKE